MAAWWAQAQLPGEGNPAHDEQVTHEPGPQGRAATKCFTSVEDPRPMANRTTLSVVLPAIAGVALIALHFLGKGPAPLDSQPGPPKARNASPAADPFAGRALDEAKRQQRREAMRPSVMDIGEERDEKALNRKMKVFGTSPIELVGRDAEATGGLVVGQGAADLEQFLADGGHYSGPLTRLSGRKGNGQK